MGVYRYPSLRAVILERFVTYKNFATHLGKSSQEVSRKLTGDIAFTKADIIEWCDVLGIPLAESGTYFFD